MNTLRAASLVSMLTLLALGASEFQSDAARDAQRGYQRGLWKAKKEYIFALENAMSSAAKNKNDKEVLKIAEELNRMRAVQDSEQLDDFPGSVVDVEWTGSPNMGNVVFRHDGALVADKDDQPCRWAVIGAGTISSLHSNGWTTVFAFDKARQKVTAYATGQKNGVAWEATRSH